MNMVMLMKSLSLAAFALLMNACVIVIGGDDEELLFGPDEHCPGECVNPADETCYHLPGGCGRGSDDEEDEVECDPCAG